jgi:mycofactocin precursor
MSDTVTRGDVERIAEEVVQETEQTEQTEQEPIVEPLIEDVSIDGMCGVY